MFNNNNNSSYFNNNSMSMFNVAERRFYIWKLELWWIAFDDDAFYPKNRVHLIGNWFWRI